MSTTYARTIKHFKMGPIFGIKNFRVLCTHTVVANKKVNSWGPYPFYPTKTALLFHDFTAVWFMLYNFVASCNSIAIQTIKRHWHDEQPI